MPICGDGIPAAGPLLPTAFEHVLVMGGMVVMMCWKNSSLPLKLRAQKHSTSSPRSSTAVWMEDLCSPSLAASPWPVGVDSDVGCSPDDKEVDVWATVIRGSVVVIS